MAKWSDSDDELPIAKHAREAAEAARETISQGGTWDAARQLRGMRDHLRQAGETVGRQLPEANRQVTEFVGSLIRPVLDAGEFVRSREVQELLKRAHEAFRWLR